jgi:hypothetical protein
MLFSMTRQYKKSQMEILTEAPRGFGGVIAILSSFDSTKAIAVLRALFFAKIDCKSYAESDKTKDR